MASTNLPLFATFMIVSLVMVGIGLPESVYAQYKTGKPTEKQCEDLYFPYKELGESKFRLQYSSKFDINICVKHYKDPNWSFKGKDQIDKRFDKITQNPKAYVPERKQPDTKQISIFYKIKNGGNKYLLGLDVCAGTTDIKNPSILVSSDVEAFLLTSKITITYNTCSLFQTTIDAKYGNSIAVKWPDEKIQSNPAFARKTI